MSTRIKRLAFVTDAPGFGGAERYILSMADCARRHDVVPHIHWMPMPGAEENVFGRYRVGDLSVTATPSVRTQSVNGVIRSVRNMIKRFEPDAMIINACGRPRFWLVPWLARQAGIRSAWVHHMVDSRDPRRMPPSLLGGRVQGLGLWRWPQTIRHRLAAMGSSATVTSNPDDADHLARFFGIRRDRMAIVPPGLNTSRFRYDPYARRRLHEGWGLNDRNAFVVGTAGRCVSDKGMHILIDAVAKLKKSGKDVVCVIAGNGPELDRLIERARGLGIDKSVRFIADVRDMSSFYSSLDAFVLCSGIESFGLVLTEAMACECPVIATPTAGARTQIEHDRTGWLLKQRCADELADVLLRFEGQPDMRRALGMSARQRAVDLFDIERTWNDTIALLGTQVENDTTTAMTPCPTTT